MDKSQVIALFEGVARQPFYSTKTFDHRVSLHMILGIVANRFSVRPSDILARRRPEDIVRARHAFCLVANHHHNMSVIGRFLGRDPSAVLNAVRRGNALMDTNWRYAALVNQSIEMLGKLNNPASFTASVDS